MPRFSVSLGFHFTEVPLLDRFALAAAAGFRAVEMFWPHADVGDLDRVRRSAGVEVVLFNMNEGDYEAGERGFACRPERRDSWRADFRLALDLARRIECRKINVLSGRVTPGQPRQEYLDCLVDNLRWAAQHAAAAGVHLLVEPLNHLTHPLQLCQRTGDVIEVIDMVGDPAVFLQYDVFHAQRSEGNIIATLRAHHTRIAHVQIADVPSRSAPGTGELNFAAILAELDALGYEGHVGLEYLPPPPPAGPFDWLPEVERGR